MRSLRQSRVRVAALLAGAAAACAAGPAVSAPGAPGGVETQAARSIAPVRTLIDREFRETTARVVKIDAGSVWTIGPSDPPGMAARSRPVAELVAIVAAEPTRMARSMEVDERQRVTVTLVDGQRLVGKLPRAGKAAEGAKDVPLTIETVVGTVRVPLDHVARLAVGALHDAPASAGRNDAVVLANGDRVEGFVDSIAGEVVVQIEGARSARVPLERVRDIVLANPRTAISGARAWLADGSVLSVSEVAQPAEGVLAARVAVRGSEAPPVPLPGLLALAFDASRLTPLAGLAPAQVRPSPDRRWSRPPGAAPGPAVLDAPDLEIPGPMSVEWELPAGAVKLAGVAELAHFAEGWGDCTVLIELAGAGGPKRLWTQRLSSPGAYAPFSVGLGSGERGRKLRVSVVSGDRGPIQNRVILRRPLILLDATAR